MSHMTKLLLKIIQRWVIAKIDQEICIFQGSFRPRIGTRAGIFNIRIICEPIIELRQDVFISFIDYKKAFDKVKHSKVMECLKDIGIDEKDLRITAGLYWDQAAVVKTKIDLSSEFSIKRGVRQGCVLSSNLFNLYTDKIFKEVIDRNGVNIGGMNINNLRCADDTALIALNAADLTTLLDKAYTCGKPYGMEMSIVKTKSMVVSKTVHKIVDLELDGKLIEQVSKFVYLGHMTSEHGRGDAEIARRILIEKRTFDNMRKSLACRNINTSLRFRLLKCYVWSTVTYGVETWTISRAMSRRLEAFEMWCYMRMLSISYIEHKTNEEVLGIMKIKRLLIDSIRKRMPFIHRNIDKIYQCVRLHS